jgi:hypothetical protein
VRTAAELRAAEKEEATRAKERERERARERGAAGAKAVGDGGGGGGMGKQSGGGGGGGASEPSDETKPKPPALPKLPAGLLPGWGGGGNGGEDEQKQKPPQLNRFQKTEVRPYGARRGKVVLVNRVATTSARRVELLGNFRRVLCARVYCISPIARFQHAFDRVGGSLDPFQLTDEHSFFVPSERPSGRRSCTWSSACRGTWERRRTSSWRCISGTTRTSDRRKKTARAGRGGTCRVVLI